MSKNKQPQHSHPQDPKAAPEKAGITIYINGKPYHSPNAKFSGADLRRLSVPPIGPDQNIFRAISGKDYDIQLADADAIVVNMREAHLGRHFFSDTITASKDAVSRRAYFIYLEEGSQPGRDVENWTKAEAQLNTRKSVVNVPAP